MEFANNLLNSLKKPSDDSGSSNELQWATKLGDDEGIQKAKLREAEQADMLKELPGRVTAAGALEGHIARKTERRDIRLSALSAAQKSGKLSLFISLNLQVVNRSMSFTIRLLLISG